MITLLSFKMNCTKYAYLLSDIILYCVVLLRLLPGKLTSLICEILRRIHRDAQ